MTLKFTKFCKCKCFPWKLMIIFLNFFKRLGIQAHWAGLADVSCIYIVNFMISQFQLSHSKFAYLFGSKFSFCLTSGFFGGNDYYRNFRHSVTPLAGIAQFNSVSQHIVAAGAIQRQAVSLLLSDGALYVYYQPRFLPLRL